MRDCENVEIREQLPELLHGRLGPSERAVVEQHLAGCAACRDELDVLRTARAVLIAAPTPRLDHAAIAAAVSRARVQVEPRPVRWRWAAAITVIVLGGTSVATAVRSFRGEPAIDSTYVTGPAVVAQGDTPSAVPSAAAATPARLTAGGGIDDLADEDLEALIGNLETIEVAPRAEPEAARQSGWITGSTGGN